MSTVITHKQFPNHKVYKMDLCGRPLTIEVGKVAELANASAMVTLRRDHRAGGRHRRPPSPGRRGLLPPERGL